MFNSYEFTFAGESCFQYGLMIYDFDGKGQDNVSFGNKASIIEKRINNRVQPIHFGVNYHKEPLQFKLVFGAEMPLDRYELESISMWLTGHQDYQWLSIDQPDLEHVQFRCLITSLTPLAHGWLPVAFEATVVCDCPYAYGYPFSETYTINGETDILFRNEGSAPEYLTPTLEYNRYFFSGGEMVFQNLQPFTKWTEDDDCTIEEERFYTDVKFENIMPFHSAKVVQTEDIASYFLSAKCFDGYIRVYAKTIPASYTSISIRYDFTVSRLTITNTSDNDRVFNLDFSSPMISLVEVDNNNHILIDKTLNMNLYDGFNFNFFRALRGDNYLTVVGSGELTISGRFLYNVAG